MAGFTFGDHRETSSTGTEANGVDSGKPGVDSGTPSAENGNTGTTGANGGNESQSADPNAPYGFTKDGTPRKRRAGGGRKPGSGNASGPSSATDESGKVGLDVKNDRAKVRQNIAGIHAMAAVLTKQPILNLKDSEADALTNSLCDVADHHGMNLISAGGAFGLYASLATTAYMIYVPRIMIIRHNKAAENAKNANPSMYGEEAPEQPKPKGGTMDFSGDVMH